MRKLLLGLVLVGSVSCNFQTEVGKEDRGLPDHIRDAPRVKDAPSEGESNEQLFGFDPEINACTTSRIGYKTRSTDVKSGFLSITKVGAKVEDTRKMDPKKEIGPEVDVYLEGGTLILEEGQNFNFLKSVKIWVGPDKVSETLIAWKVDIPNGKKKLVLSTDSQIEISDQIRNGTPLTFVIRASQPRESSRVHGRLAFRGAKNCT
jgi:hypothetical protein